MRRRRQNGFALLLVFAMMSAAAVMIYIQLPRFVMESQRAKEQLLIDRGEQYQRAIQLYYRKMKTWPQSLDDLEKGNSTRFLRKRYLDPFTGKAEWRLVHVNNGIYTDSLVYNNDPNAQKSKAQTFVAEIPSIGTNGADADGVENKNQALRAGASDKSADPLDALPEGLRQFVFRGSIAQGGQKRPEYNAEDDVQAPLPTPGVYGVKSTDFSGFSASQIPPSATGGQGAEVAGPSPVPGVGGVSFEEIQRRMAEEAKAAAAGGGQQQSIGTGGSFIGGAPVIGAPYSPPITPGAAGLSYTAIAGNNGNYAATNAPPVPGTNGGSPGGFIGGGANTQGGQGNVPPAFAGFGQPGTTPQGYGNPGGQQAQGFGNPGAAGAPGGAAANLLNQALFGPRQQQGTQGMAVGGSGLVGVASKYKGESVKVYRERSRFQHWEFIYDPAKDKSMKAAGLPGQNQPLPGGLPPGTAQQPVNNGAPGQALPAAVPGTAYPVPGQSGFGNTGPVGGFGATGGNTNRGGGSFIGGPAPNTAPIPINPAPGTTGTTGTTGQQQTAPPRSGGGGFIGGK